MRVSGSIDSIQNPWLKMLVSALFLALGMCWLEQMVGYSLAGVLFCDSVCVGCEGPGRVVSWRTPKQSPVAGSQTKYETTSVVVCHNPRINVDLLTQAEVRGRVEQELSAYVTTPWRVFPLYLGVFLVGGVVLLLSTSVTDRRGASRARRRHLR